MNTFKAFSSGLLKEVFLTAVVGYVPGKLPYPSQWVDLKYSGLMKRDFVQILVWAEVYVPLRLALGENCRVLWHLVLRHRRPIRKPRLFGTGVRWR
ncbi:hypothetical protein RRF57_000037 [Xylaria bambusicola]|uniref:Uncharacterized protein n=1 Tax=Xylaria bambusicola TaxID=326684 RepID=A0AAN7Z5B9_9PEZI